MNIKTIRNVLNILFIVGAISAVVGYFVADYTTFIYIAASAIFFKVLEFIIRFTN